MMFSKKEVEKLNDSIKEINLKLSETDKNLKNLDNQELLNLIIEKIGKLEEKQAVFGGRFEEETRKLSELNEVLRKRIDSFKILEDKASKRLFEEVNIEFKSKLEGLFHTSKCYQELEDKMIRIKNRLGVMEEEINKFSMIAKEVRVADFELAKFAKQVTQENGEKLKLIRENEKLKMLIARERGRRFS